MAWRWTSVVGAVGYRHQGREQDPRRGLAVPAPRAVQEGSARYDERADDEHRVALLQAIS